MCTASKSGCSKASIQYLLQEAVEKAYSAGSRLHDCSRVDGGRRAVSGRRSQRGKGALEQLLHRGDVAEIECGACRSGRREMGEGQPC